jgi:hypothetical protein
MSNRRKAALLGLVSVLGLSASARAEDRPPAVVPVADAEMPVERAFPRPADREPEPPSERRWYGLQTLGANALATGASFACLQWGGAYPCVLPFMFGGPLVHAGHGNYGRAAFSLAAHVAFPSLGLLVGAAATPATKACTSMTRESDGGTITTSSCDYSYGSGAGVGAVIGLVAAAVVDAAMAYDDRMPPRAEIAARRAPAVLPTMALGQNDAVFGLEGRF